MTTDTLFGDLHALVRRRLEPWPAQREGYHWPGYTYDHTVRVVNLAVEMARELDADVAVVRFAALLHDIRKDAGRDHAQVGAEEARRLLSAHGLPEAFTRSVAAAIECHSGGNGPDHPPENLCLGDADLIDANFGLVGAWRFITIRSGRGDELADTIAAMAGWLPQKDALADLLNTDLGRQVAAQRSAVMHDFCRGLAEALDGERNARGHLWLAEYYHRHSDTGRLPEQLAALNGEAPVGERPPASVAPLVRALNDEVAGRR